MADSTRRQNVISSLPQTTEDVSPTRNDTAIFASGNAEAQYSSLSVSGQGCSLEQVGHTGNGEDHLQNADVPSQDQVQYRHGQQHFRQSRSAPPVSGSSLPIALGSRPISGTGLQPSLTATGLWSAPSTVAYPVVPPTLESSGARLRTSGGNTSSIESQGNDYVQILDGDEGWDLEFVPARSEKHDCPICLLVLREPMQTECGHRFCRGCILKWLRESEPRCPVDNQSLDETQLFPDNFAKREILALHVKCPNHQKGCDQIVVLKHLQSHLNDCICSLTPCPNECASVLLRGKLSEHLLSQCPKRKIKCSYCQLDIVAEKQQMHIQECPQWMISCHACGAELVRQQLKRHLSMECLKAVVKCQYNLLGCTYEGERQSLVDHEQVELGKHMGLINHAIIRLYTFLGIVPTSVQSAQSPSALGHEPVEASGSGRSGAASFPSYFVNLGERMNLLQQLFQHISPGDMSALTSSEMFTGSPSISTQASSAESVQASGLIYSEPGSVSIATAQTTGGVCTTSGRTSGQSPEDEERNSSNRTRFEKLSYTSEPSSRQDQEVPRPSFNENQLLSIKCQNDIQDESLARHDQKLLELMHQKDYHEKVIRELKVKVKMLESTLQDFGGRCGNGTFVWKIKNYFKSRRDAEKGDVTAIHSDSFYSGFYGYKLCIRVNLNGVDAARGTHLSLFIHFMQGEYDDLLEWPFSGRIVLTIIDQNPICELRNHISETLTSKPNLAAFQRPVSARNHKGFGYMEFLPLSVIDGSTYVRNDTLIIKANIIPTNS